MRALLLLTLLLSLFSLCASSPKQLLSLHQKAEAAMQKKDFISAKNYYKKLIEKLENEEAREVNWQSYVDSYLRLAEAHIQLDEFDEAKHKINCLLAKCPPTEFLSSIQLVKVRTERGQEGLLRSYIEMKEIQKSFPLANWSQEMRLFFHTVEISLDEYFDELMKKAKRFYVAKHYKEALSFYEQLQSAIKQGGYPKAANKESLIPKKVLLELARTHYKCAHYNQVVTLAKEPEDTIDCELLFLAAKAHKKRVEYQEAIVLFEKSIEKKERCANEQYYKALYELGTLYKRVGNLKKAKEHFLQLSLQTESESSVICFAKLFLAEIYLEEKDLCKAEALLDREESTSELLQQRLLFLTGRIAMERGELRDAIEHFTEALGCHMQDKAKIALYLVQCHLSCGSAKDYERAEKILTYLLDTKESQTALLFLATLYLQKKEPSKAYILLSEHLEKFSLEKQLLAHLIMAKTTYDETHLLQANDPKYAHLKEYSYGFFCRGVLALEKSEFMKAAELFEMAFSLSKNIEALTFEITSLFHKQNYAKALSLLSKLQGGEKKSLDFLYLKGLILAYFEETSFMQEALCNFKELLELDNEGLYSDKAHYMMGSLYYRLGELASAKEHFITLHEHYPESDLTPAALYWAAESMENDFESATCRSKLVEEHPESTFGAESYFKLHTLAAYLQGEKSALTHLEAFRERYPASTLNIAVSYLLSLHTKNNEKASKLLDSALDHFALLPKEKQREGLVYFYCKAMLQKAKLQEESAIMLLKPLLQECEKREEFIDERGINFLLEEVQYALASAYSKDKKYHKAQKLLFAIVDANARCQVKESYYLAKSWQLMGDLAKSRGEHKAALTSYELALKSGENYLSDHERLTLLLESSECYRARNMLNEAMRKLSKVINEDVASPLRIKAMMKRAEIYELQKRYELAKRQLEAIIKKGGKWAELAGERLEKLNERSSIS